MRASAAVVYIWGHPNSHEIHAFIRHRLIVLRGNPLEVLPYFWREHGVTKLCFEADTEGYARARDAQVVELAKQAGITLCCKFADDTPTARMAISINALTGVLDLNRP